jgi:hypothetical protein
VSSILTRASNLFNDLAGKPKFLHSQDVAETLASAALSRPCEIYRDLKQIFWVGQNHRKDRRGAALRTNRPSLRERDSFYLIAIIRLDAAADADLDLLPINGEQIS